MNRIALVVIALILSSSCGTSTKGDHVDFYDLDVHDLYQSAIDRHKEGADRQSIDDANWCLEYLVDGRAEGGADYLALKVAGDYSIRLDIASRFIVGRRYIEVYGDVVHSNIKRIDGFELDSSDILHLKNISSSGSVVDGFGDPFEDMSCYFIAIYRDGDINAYVQYGVNPLFTSDDIIKYLLDLGAE